VAQCPRILPVESVTLIGPFLIALSIVTFELMLDIGTPSQGPNDHLRRRTLADQVVSLPNDATEPLVMADIETDLQYGNDTIQWGEDAKFEDNDAYQDERSVDDSNVDEYFDNTQNEVSDAIDDLPSRDEDEKAIQIDSLTIPSGAKDVSPNTKQMIRDRSLQAKEAALKDLKEA
jgi:hypothetical protein